MINHTRKDNMETCFGVKTEGILCEGQFITLGWPTPEEFDLITALRNAPNVRKWFLDDRPIDPVKNRLWLEHGMKKPYEAVLSIRLKMDNSFLGTIGWSDWNLESKTAWFGRLAINLSAVKKIRNKLPLDYKGVAFDAALTLRDFVFLEMKLEYSLTYYFADNKLASYINKGIGLLETDRVIRTRIDGSKVETIEMKMYRYHWEFIAKRILQGKERAK